MRIVQSASAGSDSKLQQVLDRIASSDNVPRKRAKFLHFMKNSIALNDQAMVERVWTLYEANDKAAVATKSLPLNTTLQSTQRAACWST
ncbi:Myosin-like protein [Globisporangium polare]